jgi:hypothetical protein
MDLSSSLTCFGEIDRQLQKHVHGWKYKGFGRGVRSYSQLFWSASSPALGSTHSNSKIDSWIRLRSPLTRVRLARSSRIGRHREPATLYFS